MKYFSPLGALLASISIASLPTLIFASVAPSVTSFQVSPSSISNNYATVATWSIDSDMGAHLMVTCPIGVSVKTDKYETIACGTRFAVGLNIVDTQGLIFTNISGTPKTVSLTLYPKDSNGTDYDAGAMSATLTVGTAAQPLTAFDASAHSVVSKSPITFSWTGVDLPGTNFQFECVNNVQLFATDPTSGSPTPLACGTTAFSTMLGMSGSQIIYPVTLSAQAQTVTATIMPSIGSGSYDLTHSLSTAFTVTALPPTPEPSVSAFSVLPAIVASGTPVTITWALSNASSSNLEIDCPEGVTVYSVVGTSSTPIPCNALSFAMPLSAVGTTTILISSIDRFNAKPITALIIPMNSKGEYLRNLSRAVNIKFFPSTLLITPAATTDTKTILPPLASTSKASSSHYTFTLPLKRASRNADVTALQKFLALDPAVYPEATVSGYYGAATALAVGRLQIKYKLVVKSDGALTTVGPKTRAFLNTVQ